MLVSKGLVETRVGSGNYVTGPNAAMISESMSLFLRLQYSNVPIPYDQVLEVRYTLEVEIARLAAHRALPEDIASLEQELERQRHLTHDSAAFAASDVAFHAKLATATHNVLFPVLVNSISDVMLEVRRLGNLAPGAYSHALIHHQAILDAVKAGDQSAAERAMRAHLHEGKNFMLQGLQMEAARKHGD
jgi:DNA-binding FadR family transcriptional regulator